MTGLENGLSKEPAAWESIMSSAVPEKSLLPQPWNRLSHLSWLILIGTLRKDKVRMIYVHYTLPYGGIFF